MISHRSNSYCAHIFCLFSWALILSRNFVVGWTFWVLLDEFNCHWSKRKGKDHCVSIIVLTVHFLCLWSGLWILWIKSEESLFVNSNQTSCISSAADLLQLLLVCLQASVFSIESNPDMMASYGGGDNKDILEDVEANKPIPCEDFTIHQKYEMIILVWYL